MSLESLLTLVEKLRKRIETHGSVLSEREERTRYALIDPLLRELGWDTENPDLVIPEYKTGDGRPDYALLSDGKPIMMVEAKRLGRDLREGFTKALAYCMEKGTRYCAVTDGRRWEIYDTHNTGPKDEKRIVEFDFKSQPTVEACLKALTLWGLRMSGHVATSPESRTPNTQTIPSSDKQKWQSLSELNQRPHDTPPVEIQFPDNSTVPITKWKSILVEAAKWLEKNKLLTKNDCPIYRTPRSKRYAISTEDVHSDKKEFVEPARAGSLYIETHVSGKDAVKDAQTIIKHVGQDPAQFKVRLSPP